MRRTRRGLLPAVLLLACGGLAAATLAQRVEAVLAALPVAHGAFWGIQAVDLASGKTLYELNPNHFFVPASNTKLFTTALALTALGPDAVFHTRVLADDRPDADGVLAGSLYLVGGGDPSIDIADLADQVADQGVRRVTGLVVGVDPWVWQPYAEGWALEDPNTRDGAAVSALSFHGNLQTLTVRPGAAVDALATVLSDPPIEYFRIVNHVRSVAADGERSIHVDRLPGDRTLRIWGTVPLRSRGEDVAVGVDDPALFAALALRRALGERGIAVEGGAGPHHLFPEDVADLKRAKAPAETGGVELARSESAPLVECLRVVDKTSQNLHAEMMLRAVGRARRNVGSREAGLEEMKTFLAEAGVSAGSYNLVDASGLTRIDLVTPAGVVRLLRHMYASEAWPNFLSLLAVGGKDGTLKGRFTGAAQTGRVHAKTGSLAHVSALSGYALRPNKTWVAFSILVNNYNGQPAEIRRAIDRVCALIME